MKPRVEEREGGREGRREKGERERGREERREKGERSKNYHGYLL